MQLSERKQRKMDDNSKQTNASAACSDITFSDDNRQGRLSDVTRPAITRPRPLPPPSPVQSLCETVSKRRQNELSMGSVAGNRPPEATTTKTAAYNTSSILSATCEPKTTAQTNEHRQFDRCIIYHDVVKRFTVTTLQLFLQLFSTEYEQNDSDFAFIFDTVICLMLPTIFFTLILTCVTVRPRIG